MEYAKQPQPLLENSMSKSQRFLQLGNQSSIISHQSIKINESIKIIRIEIKIALSTAKYRRELPPILI
jgi:hypothetical protein